MQERLHLRATCQPPCSGGIHLYTSRQALVAIDGQVMPLAAYCTDVVIDQHLPCFEAMQAATCNIIIHIVI